MHYNLLNKDWVPIGTELTVICGKNTLPLLKPTIVCEVSENVANWNDTLPECKGELNHQISFKKSACFMKRYIIAYYVLYAMVTGSSLFIFHSIILHQQAS